MTFAVATDGTRSGQALGAALGDEHFACILRRLEAAGGAGRLLVLDFQDVAATNGSYLKAVVLRLLLAARQAVISDPRQSFTGLPVLDVFPVLKGLSPAVREEVADFFAARRLPVLVAEGPLPPSAGLPLPAAVVEGWLEPTLRETLGGVLRAGEATAPELHEAYPEQRVTVTAWNNRLTELCGLRLLDRRRQGRAWVYRSVANQISYGRRLHQQTT